METHTLPRTANTAVRFKGRLLAEVVEPPRPFKKARTDTRRWFELRLYRHEDGRYVVSIGYRTGDEREQPADDVFVCATQDEVIDLLTVLPDGDEDDECRQTYDPTEHVEGFPELHEDHPRFQRFRDRHERLMRRVEEEYDRRVGVLLAQAGFVEDI